MTDSGEKNPLIALIKKEFLDKFRNKWVIALTLIWIGLIVLVSILGGYNMGMGVEFKNLKFAIRFGNGVIQFLIPIIAIMLGYKAIAEEIDSKSIGPLLTSNLERRDIVVGKFLGLFSVLGVSILVGLGAGGLIVGASVGFGHAGIYFGFILLSLLFGAIYIAISMAMSSAVTKVSRALAGGVFIWLFFNMIWQYVLFGLFYATGGSISSIMTGSGNIPSWYNHVMLLNPNQTFSMGVGHLLGESLGLMNLVDFYLVPIALALWVVIPILLGLLYFQRRDF